MPVDFSVSAADFCCRNRGPWTTVEYEAWGGFSLGQSTALTGGAGGEFKRGELVELFVDRFPVDCYHQPEQTHGSNVRETGRYSAGHLDVDGLFTTNKGHMLTLQTADCFPLYLRNVSGDKFALLHAGWRGACGNILPLTVSNYFEEPVEIIVGAGIGVETYPVGLEVVEAAAESLGWPVQKTVEREVVLSGENDFYLDLLQLLKHQAEKLEGQVNDFKYLPLNTGKSGELPLFSYRESQGEERMLNWIFRKGV